jgi:hypothetical protein
MIPDPESHKRFQLVLRFGFLSYLRSTRRENAKSYVVLELKVSRGYERAVGQLLRYMTWIDQNYAEEGKKKVRGIIVARKISDDIKLACARIADVQLFE